MQNKPGRKPDGESSGKRNKTSRKSNRSVDKSRVEKTSKSGKDKQFGPRTPRLASSSSPVKRKSSDEGKKKEDYGHSESGTGKRKVSSRKTTGKPNTSGEKSESGYSVAHEIRLNKYIANGGICSRREADELIKSGVITINGKPVTQVGTKVTDKDEVRFNGELISNEKKVYILLNKPKDFVTTVDDPFAKKTVMQLVRNACKERVYPVGRLDRNTTGVLLLTNDGDLTGRLTHPKYNRKKIYHVFLDRSVTKNDMIKIKEGIELEDGPVKADVVSYVDPDDKKQIGIELHSGRNRIVRRIFEHLGYNIRKLDRVYFAGLTKKNIQRGKWRLLTEREIELLKRG